MLTGLEEAKQIITVLSALVVILSLGWLNGGKCEHGCAECDRKKQANRERNALAQHDFHLKGLPDRNCSKCKVKIE